MIRRLAAIGLVLALGSAALPVVAASTETVPLYRMVRSLQSIQDAVINGDLNSVEMQRFLLGEIDKRLRAADMVVFDDPRNVDAALIYAMSGGNPATLELLVARDIEGNFDNRVSDALRKYLTGKGTLIAKTLGDIAVEYKNAKIGPYLALVAGNVTLAKDPAAALKFYDWARLTAPGTIVEEAARSSTRRRSMRTATHAASSIRPMPASLPISSFGSSSSTMMC